MTRLMWEPKMTSRDGNIMILIRDSMGESKTKLDTAEKGIHDLVDR